jgi:hypothetical protein
MGHSYAEGRGVSNNRTLEPGLVEFSLPPVTPSGSGLVLVGFGCRPNPLVESAYCGRKVAPVSAGICAC